VTLSLFTTGEKFWEKNKRINKSNQINQRKGAPGLIPRSNLFLSRQLLTGATRQCVHECEPNIWNIIQSNGVAATQREHSRESFVLQFGFLSLNETK
jgi:hypothetical protein